MSNNDDISVKLHDKTIIKANKRLFKTIAITNNYIEIFTFEKDRLLVQIETIEDCKMKIITRSTGYAKLVTKFLEDELWKENK